MSYLQQMFILAILSVIWATTTIKPLRKGWKNLDPNDRQIIMTKITLALALVAGSVIVFVKSH